MKPALTLALALLLVLSVSACEVIEQRLYDEMDAAFEAEFGTSFDDLATNIAGEPVSRSPLQPRMHRARGVSDADIEAMEAQVRLTTDCELLRSWAADSARIVASRQGPVRFARRLQGAAEQQLETLECRA